MRDDKLRSEFPDEDYATAFWLCSACKCAYICMRHSGKIANLSRPDSFPNALKTYILHNISEQPQSWRTGIIYFYTKWVTWVALRTWL